MRIIPNPKIIYQSEEIRIVDNGKEEVVKQSHVTLLVEGVHFNLKNEILRYYGEEKLTKELYKRFRDDLYNNKFQIETNERDQAYITEGGQRFA